jgi:hypothetical protein
MTSSEISYTEAQSNLSILLDRVAVIDNPRWRSLSPGESNLPHYDNYSLLPKNHQKSERLERYPYYQSKDRFFFQLLC